MRSPDPSPPPLPARGFARLPVELLPLILGHLAAPSHLHAAALVCSAWAPYAREALYRHVWVRPWQKGADWKLVRLLETLSSSAPLARLVRRLEIRSYPPPQILTGALSSATLLSFLALPNVSSLAFTRDHSLSPQLLSAIASSMPGLRELEVNAHSAGSFDPRCLVGITGRLERLVLVMPDRGTVGVLEEWVRRVHEEGVRAGRPYPGLRELTILSKFSPLVNDGLLHSLAPSLPHLRALTLTACTRLTSSGVLALLRSAAGSARTRTVDGRRTTERGVVKLGLESLDHLRLEDLQPELAALAPDLRWVSLTPGTGQPVGRASVDRQPPPQSLSSGWLFDTLLAPFAPTLETVHVSRPSDPTAQVTFVLPPSGFPALATLSLPALAPGSILPADLPSRAPRLAHLFVALDHPTFAWLSMAVGQWPALSTVHFVVAGSGGEAAGAWEPTMQDLRALAHEGRALRQVGLRTRVYDVHRSPSRSYSPRTEGREDVVLDRFDMEAGGRVPDVFLLGRFLG